MEKFLLFSFTFALVLAAFGATVVDGSKCAEAHYPAFKCFSGTCYSCSNNNGEMNFNDDDGTCKCGDGARCLECTDGTIAQRRGVADDLCTPMQSGGDIWYCEPCGGDYSCQDKYVDPNNFCIVDGNNVPGCTLTNKALEWWCCRDCSMTGYGICEYQAPSGGTTSGSSTSGSGGGGSSCSDCNAGGTCYQACVSKCGGASKISDWACQTADGIIQDACVCDDGAAPGLTGLEVALIVIGSVIGCFCVVGIVVALIAVLRKSTHLHSYTPVA